MRGTGRGLFERKAVAADLQRIAVDDPRRAEQDFGAACAFLCSQHAGYITGQNLVMDGGAINTTM